VSRRHILDSPYSLRIDFVMLFGPYELPFDVFRLHSKTFDIISSDVLFPLLLLYRSV
jgi:hypothetical protein